MQENLKKLTDESRKEMIARLADKAVSELIARSKAATDVDSGSFKVIVSTADRDRQGESVKQDGWDLTFFKLNPVVLWGHDYGSLPIGVCTSINLEGGKLVAEGKFAPADANPFAQNVRRLYDLGMVRTTSVGFIPKEFDPNNDEIITKAELLEFSFVPVPANPYALSLGQIKHMNLDVEMLMTKGLKIEVKEKDVQAGDGCQMDDGTPGILAVDSDNPGGAMICIPYEGKDLMGNVCEFVARAMKDFDVSLAKAHKDHGDNHTASINALKEAMKGIDMSKAVESKSIDLCLSCIDDYSQKVSLENQNHSKSMGDNWASFSKVMASAKSMMEKVMKDFPEGDEGDDARGNLTADGVRMQHAVKDAYTHLSAACTALKEYADSEGGNNADVDDAGAAKGSKPSPVNSELEKFLNNRELVRTVSTALGQVLRKYNAKDRAAK